MGTVIFICGKWNVKLAISNHMTANENNEFFNSLRLRFSNFNIDFAHIHSI